MNHKGTVELAELQDKEVGDGTTSVVIVAAELLKVIVIGLYNCFCKYLILTSATIRCSLQRANDLVRNKIHPTSIISGYRLSSSFCFFSSIFNFLTFLTVKMFAFMYSVTSMIIRNDDILENFFRQLAMREACKYIDEKLAVKVMLS